FNACNQGKHRIFIGRSLCLLWKSKSLIGAAKQPRPISDGHSPGRKGPLLTPRSQCPAPAYSPPLTAHTGLMTAVTDRFYAAEAIKRRIELDWGTEDEEYLEKVETHVKGALDDVTPDVIIYNAGTDILDGDPLGGLSVSPQGIIKRDEIVFTIARSRSIPILMVTSGGFQPRTARIIADSIINLHNLGLISNSQPSEPRI
ncbi:unnamed protein product, partial [Ranitomeya imitator]